ncbi:galactonate dehydratase (plasmid) [Phaeobacter inhibens]|uniref:galactonate dehydratase n=1 Tax=Phaeobacter inhibens TaxID=221822 RepID=UPI0021A77DB3|nr:galactonate dehydratase [Phaeobacter inhibens]UWS06063.1 galactonate dehydratase [Phaeobacter inhibens]
MKIISLKTYAVPPRWLFLKIETDEGLVGWGEPDLEGHAETLAAKCSELEDFLIGADPLCIEDIWQMIYRNGCYRGGPVLMSALSGVDMALWDIKGKYHDVPAYQLLGGPVRNKIRSYCWVGGDRPQNLIENARALQQRGYDAFKMNACEEMQIVDRYSKVDAILRRIGELRDDIGIDMDFALDFHGRVHVPMAKTLVRELEPFKPMFIEDTVVPEQMDAMADIARSTSIPLCTGERLHSRYAFKPVFEKRAASVINPDISHVGGLSEMVRIGHWAEAYDVALAPHCPLGPITLAASLQVDALCHNAFVQEQSLGIHYNHGVDMNQYLTPDSHFICTDGYLPIPTGPGLGITLDEEVIQEQAKIGHRWRAPVWRHDDGSISEW